MRAVPKLRALFCLLLLPSACSLRAAEPIHALLIAGGCCHDYATQKQLLTEGISARANVTWDIVLEGAGTRTIA